MERSISKKYLTPVAIPLPLLHMRNRPCTCRESGWVLAAYIGTEMVLFVNRLYEKRKNLFCQYVLPWGSESCANVRDEHLHGLQLREKWAEWAGKGGCSLWLLHIVCLWAELKSMIIYSGKYRRP